MMSLIRFYGRLFVRRLPLMMLVFVLVAGIGLALAVRLPPVFTADARLLVEGAQIPDELAASTVRTNPSEQLEVIQQRLMTRANLIDIANEYQVFDDLSSMNPDRVVERMREQTTIRNTGGRDRATLMTISFNANDPRTAANVVNEFVTLVLDENVRFRTDRAEDTQDFFEQEVRRLETALNDQKQQILVFQQENLDALPDSVEFRLNRQSLLQERVAESARAKAVLTEQRVRLINVYNATGQLGSGDEAALTPEQRQLRQLQDELDQALTIYSETNPRVRLLRTRVEQLEEVVKGQLGGADAQSEGASILDIELSQIDTQIDFLDRQIAEAEAELVVLNDTLERTPANSIALDALEREYENVQQQYNVALDRLARAQTGERIELLAKGQRIAVVEQATVPNTPSSPNRPLIAGGGVFMGFAAAAGLFLLLELLNTAIRRPKELTTALGITPFAVIPFMETTRERRHRRALLVFLAIGVVGVIVAMLWGIHTYYLPIDLLLERVGERLGLDTIGI